MKSECRGCGEVFSSISSFDKHRTGSYGEAVYEKGTASYKHQRRCMDESEMLVRGLVKNDKGWWTNGGTFDGSIFREQEKEEVTV